MESELYTILGNQTIAVIGNGDITQEQREEIKDFSVTIRFNDVNNKMPGERTTIHVIRHPSNHVDIDTLYEWHVSPFKTDTNHKLFTPTFETDRGENNILSEKIIFPDCDCGLSCFSNQTYFGSSTGTVILDVLQSLIFVKQINVYGMNWNGDPTHHIDFKNRSIVPNCCTKCVIHSMNTTMYGTDNSLGSWVILLAIFMVIVFIYKYRSKFIRLSTRYFRTL